MHEFTSFQQLFCPHDSGDSIMELPVPHYHKELKREMIQPFGELFISKQEPDDF